MKSLLDSFLAFNENALAYLAYVISSNLWYLLIIASAIACIVISLKEEVIVTVREEQQIL